jgi:uncharacterized membrane protein
MPSLINNNIMGISKLFTKEQKQEITDAIKEAENNTSGEIRVHIEGKCKVDTLDRAAEVFAQLKMHKTELRNGVLFYLSITDHKFAILGDAGINTKVPENFWHEINALALSSFKEGNFSKGLAQGILKAGEQLKAHFPVSKDDVNELSDEISFGK